MSKELKEIHAGIQEKLNRYIELEKKHQENENNFKKAVIASIKTHQEEIDALKKELADLKEALNG